MFNEGDTVRNIAADIVGVVVEVDGDTVYLEQANGVEVDFPASSLVLEDAYQAKHDTSVKSDGDAHAQDPVYDGVVQNLYPSVLELGQTLHAARKPPPGVAPKSWNDLSALQKLNAVSEATDTAVKDWIAASRPGANPTLGKFQLAILANKKPGGR